MTHKRIAIVVLLCVLLGSLTACGIPDLPEVFGLSGVAEEEYYIPMGYTIEDVQTNQETVNKNEKSAERLCTITAKSDDGSFQVADSWFAHYTYSDGWELDEKTLLSTQYRLLEDLPEDICAKLLSNVLLDETQLTSIVTDRDNFSAVAYYSYGGSSEIAGGFGNLERMISGEAKFAWDEINRWVLVDYQDQKDLTYNASFTLSAKPEVLNSERFSLKLDVNVENNIPSLSVTHYQGSIDTIGQLSISNPQLVIDEQQLDILKISFDFSRSIENVESDKNYSEYYEQLGAYYPAQGDGYIEVHSNGSANLFFNKWVYNGWSSKWENHIFDAESEPPKDNAKVYNNQINSVDESQNEMIVKVIDQYFGMVRNSEDMSLKALRQVFPQILGDDTGEFLQECLRDGTVENFDYEVIKTNCYSLDQVAARKQWEAAINEEFYDGILNPEAYAEILIKMSIITNKELLTQRELNIPNVGYCIFLLVEDNGTWGAFYVDDIFSEIPDMLFSH